MTCLQDGCTRDQDTRGYCPTHYRRRLHTGRYGWRDGSAAAAHVRKLRDELGWTWQAICDTSGTHCARGLYDGRYTGVLADNEQKILSIPLTDMREPKSVPAVGTRRRVQALGWMGWSCSRVAEEAGIPYRSLATLIWRDVTSVTTARKVAAAYDRLAHLTGPSLVSIGKARAQGFAPPLAWDEDTIDDPDAMPNLTGYDEGAVRALIEGQLPSYRPVDMQEAVRRLLDTFKPTEIARLIGVEYNDVKYYAYRRAA